MGLCRRAKSGEPRAQKEADRATWVCTVVLLAKWFARKRREIPINEAAVRESGNLGRPAGKN